MIDNLETQVSSDNNKAKRYILACYKEAKEARKDRENQWKEVYGEYSGNQPRWAQKAEWQTKLFIPRLSSMIKKTTAIMRQALIEADEFWTIGPPFPDTFSNNAMPQTQSQDNLADDKKNFVRDAVNKVFDDNNFFKTFSIAAKYAMLTSLMIAKIYYKNDWIAIEAIDPFDIYLDPSGKNRYVIHKTIQDYDAIKKSAVAGIYDLSEVEKLPLTYDSKDKREDAERRGVIPTNMHSRRQVTLLEFYGDIIDDEGKKDTIYNQVATIANENFLIKTPQPNPYYHNKPPFVITAIDWDPKSIYHHSIYENQLSLIRTSSELMESITDGAKITAVPMAEIDIDKVENADDILDTIEPGKLFKTHDGGNALTIKHFPAFAPEVMSLISAFNMEMQNTSGMTEFLQGQPTSKGRPTAREVLSKTNQGLSLFESYARNIENDWITPIIEMVYQNLIMLVTQNKVKNIKPILAKYNYNTDAMTPVQRTLLVEGDYQFKTFGISMTVSNQDRLEKIINFLKIIGNLPGIAQRLNADGILSQIAKLLSIHQSQFVNPAPAPQPMPVQPQVPGAPIVPPVPAGPPANPVQQNTQGVRK